MKRLLCVFAHPDDECYGPGGTIAGCALAGGEVHVTCFTAGEAGTIGVSKTLARDELARRRRREFVASCRALGVREERIVGAPDGRVAGFDRERALAEILSDIERLRPQVVVTFHHRGVSGHSDHIAVADLLDEAFARSGDAGPSRYYGWGIPRSRAALYERPNLVPMEDDEIAARVAVAKEAMDRKVDAIHAHQTQVEFFLSLQARFDYRQMSTPEHFALRRWRGPRPVDVVEDLFAGIADA